MTAIQTQKPVVVVSALEDSRYVEGIDGLVAADAAYMAVPLRARNGIIMGALLSIRPAAFAADDVLAAELVASLGALSMYWSRGETAGRGIAAELDALELQSELELQEGGKKSSSEMQMQSSMISQDQDLDP